MIFFVDLGDMMMTFHVRLIQGLIKPARFQYQLKHADNITGVWTKLALLFVCSLILFSIEAYVGIGTESLANDLTSLTTAEFEARKLLFGVGHALFGMIYPVLIIFIPALIFLIFFEANFQKLVITQQFVLTILLIEKAVLLPFLLLLGIDRSVSPFSFGVISNYLSFNEIVSHFFGVISLFKIAVLFFQYYFLRAILQVDKREIVIFVIVINVLFWILSTFFSYIQFEKLF